jgi:hypothetical protein
LAIGDGAPFDADLAYVDLALRVLIIPPKLMVPHVEGRIVGLEIVVAELNSSGAKCDGRSGRKRGSIPNFGE